MVTMIEVESSNVAAIGYDPKKQELYVKFQGDGARLYKYLKVPSLVWEHMQRAQSKGTFLRQILVPYFQFTQIKNPSVTAVSKSTSDRNQTSTPRGKTL
jgi:hypothetical protein